MTFYFLENGVKLIRIEKLKVKSKTLNYHWDDRNKLENDFLYLEDLQKVLVSLSRN